MDDNRTYLIEQTRNGAFGGQSCHPETTPVVKQEGDQEYKIEKLIDARSLIPCVWVLRLSLMQDAPNNPNRWPYYGIEVGHGSRSYKEDLVRMNPTDDPIVTQVPGLQIRVYVYLPVGFYGTINANCAPIWSWA